MTTDQRFWVTLLLSVAGLVMALMLIHTLRFVLIPFFVGFIGAYACKNFVKHLEKLRVGRALASAFVVISLVTLIVSLSLIAVPFLQHQLFKLFDVIPRVTQTVLSSLTPLLEHVFTKTPDIQDLESQLRSHVGDLMKLTLGFFTNLLSTTTVIANLLSWIILTPLAMFYFLKDLPRISNKVQSLIPLKWRDTTVTTAREIDYVLSAYASNQVLVCFILAVLYAIGLRIAGLEQGVAVGLVTGVISFIPYVGALIGFLASLGLSLAQTGDFSLLPAIAIVFVVINMVEGYLLTPRLIGQKIGLHPLWILFALLAGGTVLGFVRLVLTLPMAALIGVLVRLAIRTYQHSNLYKGKAYGRPARA